MNIEIANLDNLTEDEKETFNRLVKKANRKSKVFKPAYRKKYFYINMYGDVCDAGYYKYTIDDRRFELGNLFETEEQAKFAVEKQKLYIELKHYALEHNEYEIDWGDERQCKYCIILSRGKISAADYYSVQNLNQIYFTSEEIAQNAIKEIGEDRIKKYLFEVEE